MNFKNILDEDTDEIVWSSLIFVTGEIIYGGRVTDSLDRRTLSIILSNFLTSDILEEDYKFSDSGIYYAPDSSLPVSEYMNYINNLPV